MSTESIFEAFERERQAKARPKAGARRVDGRTMLDEVESSDRPAPDAPCAKMLHPIITEPGAYPDISNEQYHQTEICDSPSISSSGLKLITKKTPLHYWYQSPLNPKRPAPKQKQHLALGAALHDLLLIDGRFEQHYHVLPRGFRADHHQKWADELAEMRTAEAAGKTILTAESYDMVEATADAIGRNELAQALLTAGTPEMTLAAKDPVTGVWMRSKPDVLPETMEIIPDVKTAADASLDVYERAATRFGYFQSAAHYLDVIEQLYGPAKRRFVLITVEKEPPYCVTVDNLDGDDINYARYRNRAALNKFAEALKTGVWHGYTTPEKPVRNLQMTTYERQLIDRAIERGELSYN